MTSEHQPSAADRPGRSQQASEELFRLLVASVRDYSIFVIGADGRIATWNEGAKRIKGYEPAEIIGQPYELFFTPEDRAAGKPQQMLSEAARSGTAHDEGWRLRKDGSRFWADATLTALYHDDGTLRGYAKVTRDDTARHEAAEALRRSEERFRLSVVALREQAFYMLDPAGVIESWNAGAQQIKGYAANEVIGKHFSMFFTDDDRVSAKPERELALAARLGSFEEEGWRVRKDGTRFWATVAVTAVHDEQGRLRGFAKLTRDETSKHRANVELQRALERARRAEEQIRSHAAELERRVEERTELLTRQTEMLKRINAELEQFAYIASHDLKEPLRMITSYLDLLIRRYGDRFDERGRGYVDNVVAATVRMRELVESVLEYSRADAGVDGLEVTPVREALDKALANLQRGIAESGAEFEIGELPKVRANRIELVRLFQNLAANAIKFRSTRAPRIAISARPEGDEWIFSVADNGIGIEPQFHERLFKIFQRLHAPDEYAGSGIGLATCKKIVERHGGRIWVESTPGAGSTFNFTLPKDS